MTKGDIILISFPFSDLSGQKSRPSLVLYVDKGEDCIVAFISSANSKKRYPYDIFVKPSDLNGLKVNSLIKLNKISTLDRKSAEGLLGKLEASHMTQVNKKLRRLLSL